MIGDNSINKQYKDTLFKLIFGNKDYPHYAKELYCYLEGIDINTVQDCEIQQVQLEKALVLTLQNDVSLIIDDTMSMWEHQSKPNKNMALRGFFYASRLYEDYLKTKGSYSKLSNSSTDLIKIPTPQYYVINKLNRKVKLPKLEQQKLSDHFINKDVSYEGFEWTANVLNIGMDDYNQYEDCPALMNFAWFIDNTIKEDRLLKDNYPEMESNNRRSRALEQTIVLCKQYDIFTDVLINLEREVSDAMIDILSKEEEYKDFGSYAESIGEERTFRRMIRKLYEQYNLSLEDLARDNETSIDRIEFILTNDDSDLDRDAWWRDND